MRIIETPGKLSAAKIDAGYSKHVCRECNRHLTKAEFDAFHGCNAYHLKTELLVVPSSHHLLDIETAQDAVWFHSTNVSNWLERVQSGLASEYFGMEDGEVPYVHVGTKEAAMDRANEIYADNYGNDEETSDDAFMYQVRLKKDAVVSTHISEDTNDWFFLVEDKHKAKMEGDALRYVNRWESEGSISMLVDPNALELVSVEVIKVSPMLEKKLVAA